jgi:hypothetical protein
MGNSPLLSLEDELLRDLSQEWERRIFTNIAENQ